METKRPVMSMPMAIGAGIAFVIAAVAIAKIFDSPLSVFILAALVLLIYGVVHYQSRSAAKP